ncbi:DCC1-like thiol-disulfide oxidoreductase family protein [Yoonia sp. R2331]|uniref:DCC1-like thiol-disulfide oxidoreductase family protein n=1 Tax=Yoonia sp. R2331 TaxID=3237238 RepID=UPI0034E58874
MSATDMTGVVADPAEVRVYYDGECPFCAAYTTMLRLRETVGRVMLIDLREDADARAELAAQGFDVDQGMVVEMDGRRVGGADATNALALMSTNAGWFNRLNRAVFAIPFLAMIFYPILRAGRWITLFAMGREGINARAEAGTRQMLFSFFFGLFSLFHVFNYAFAYGRYPPAADLIAVFAAALLLLWRPHSARALALLMLASLISTIAQAPAQSNHTMLRTVVVIGYWLSFLWTFVRAKDSREIFDNFVLAGRGSLIVMYIFGIFHKINTDFLNPETSCAVTLWQDMPAPLSMVQGYWMDQLAIYGTFGVEGAIAIALIIPRTRYLGLVFGIGFHLMLGLSDYAAYIAFTTLSIAMHVLFLSRTQTARMVGSPEMAFIRERIQQPLGVAAFLIFLTGGALAMYRHDFSLSNLCLLPFVLPLCWLILRYGREETGQSHTKAAWVIGFVAAGIYFAGGAAPYFGLKTAQSINMFANLRLEEGVSNHVVFPNPPGPFTYLEDVAVVTEASESGFLRDYQQRGFAIVYYDLIAHLADNPGVTVSFDMGGQSYTNVSAADVQSDIDGMLHGPWVRKWFHFQPVQLERPEGCTL